MVLAKQLWLAGEKIGYVADAVVEHIHEERWAQVKRRYEREAIALQGIMPEVHVGFADFLRYSISAIFFDSVAALRERRFWRSFNEILLFRTMQYWGTYRGRSEERRVGKGGVSSGRTRWSP